MADERKLFDKPMDELREAFVRARFAQEDVFGTTHPEGWVSDLGRCVHLRNVPPDEVRKIMRLVHAEYAEGKRHETLRYAPITECATPISPKRSAVPTDWLDYQKAMTGAAKQSLAIVHPFPTVAAYWGCDRMLLYLANTDRTNGQLGTLHVQPANLDREYGDREYGVRATTLTLGVTFADELEAIVAEWFRGWPRAAAARQFCTELLASRIQRERTKAEADFNSAVAVSADGTKIVHAEWVCVFGASSAQPPPGDSSADLSAAHRLHDATDYLYPASVFRGQKIVLTPRTREKEQEPFRHDWLQYAISVNQAMQTPKRSHGGLWYRREFAYTRFHHPKQMLLCCSDGRVLFVHRDQCPDPLPDGRIELTA